MSRRQASTQPAAKQSTAPASEEPKPPPPDPNKTAYTIAVLTSNVPGAGTDANVFVQLQGSKGTSRDLPLEKSINHADKFEAGHTDAFYFNDEKSAGDIKRIRIRHDNAGSHPDGPGWHLKKVQVCDASTGKAYSFEYNNWISLETCGNPPQAVLTVTEVKDKIAKQFKLMAEMQKQQGSVEPATGATAAR